MGDAADEAARMIDNFSLGLTHGLMLLAAWLLMRRPDLDSEPAPGDPDASAARAPAPSAPQRRGWRRPRA